MRRFVFAGLGVFGFFVFCVSVMTHCEDALSCTGDRDCLSKLGKDFVCFRGGCIHKSEVSPPGEDKPVKKEMVTEPSKPDAAPDKPAPPEPEPVVIETIQTPDDGGAPEPDLPPMKNQRKLHEPCSDWDYAPPSEKCGPGLRCVRLTSTKALCFEDCSTNPSVCAVNKKRNECRTIAWERDAPTKPIRICVEPVGEGAACDAQQSLYCQKGQKPALVCHNGKCEKGTLCTTVGCSCESRPGAPAACDVEKTLTCDPNTKKCIRALPAFEGTPCGTYRSFQHVCPDGFVCVCPEGKSCFGFGANPTICRKICDPSNPVTSCITYRPGTICKKNAKGIAYCVTDPECKTQWDCKDQSYGKECVGAPGKRECAGLPEPGSIGFGEVCEPANQKLCKHPFLCAIIGTRKIGTRIVPYGFCSAQCDVRDPQRGHALCDSFKSGAKCSLINNNTKISICGWSCSGGQKCPSGWTCNRNICMPQP